jgi:hypothetical protein
MRLKDITEAKKQEPIKARDPNWRDMEALRKSGAAGSHGDKTKTIPRKEKYKKISMEDQFAQYMTEANSSGWDKLKNDREFNTMLRYYINGRVEAENVIEIIRSKIRNHKEVAKDIYKYGVTYGGKQGTRLKDLSKQLEKDFNPWDIPGKMINKIRSKFEDVNEADPDTLGSMNPKMRDVLSKVDADDKAQAQAAKDRAEAERQAKVKELGPQAMDDYIAKLKAHDWTYQYSDDHSVWQRGSKEADEIRRLGDIVDPDRKLYKQYSPFYEAIANERSLTKDEEKDKEKYVKGMKKNKKDFKKRYGDDAEAVMYATATKMAKESSDIFKALQQVDETATVTQSSDIATVTSPHIAIGDKKTRKKYGLTGGLPNPPKAKRIDPKDNALDMKGTSIFGGPLKR